MMSDTRCSQCSEDEGQKLWKRREKNRVAAQKSRKRQLQRADLLHEACELLERKNRKLRMEVNTLFEEQRLLTEILRTHEPVCPIAHCSPRPGPALCEATAGHSGVLRAASAAAPWCDAALEP